MYIYIYCDWLADLPQLLQKVVDPQPVAAPRPISFSPLRCKSACKGWKKGLTRPLPVHWLRPSSVCAKRHAYGFTDETHPPHTLPWPLSPCPAVVAAPDSCMAGGDQRSCMW